MKLPNFPVKIVYNCIARNWCCIFVLIQRSIFKNFSFKYIKIFLITAVDDKCTPPIREKNLHSFQNTNSTTDMNSNLYRSLYTILFLIEAVLDHYSSVSNVTILVVTFLRIDCVISRHFFKVFLILPLDNLEIVTESTISSKIYLRKLNKINAQAMTPLLMLYS